MLVLSLFAAAAGVALAVGSTKTLAGLAVTLLIYLYPLPALLLIGVATLLYFLSRKVTP